MSVAQPPFKSLGLCTDAIFWRGAGQLVRRDGYWVGKYPNNLDFYGGNLLIFDAPPGVGAIDSWPATFASEFPESEVRHVAFSWDSPEGARGRAADFVARGYAFEEQDVLTASVVTPPIHRNDVIELRPIVSDREWEAVLEQKIEHREPRFEAVAFRRFMRAQIESFRAMVAAQQGGWYGGFIGGRLVANLGFFSDGRVGRFRDVFTHPDHRRQGICATMVYEVSRRALAGGLESIVLVADPVEDAAARIYRSVGYSFREKALGLCLYPNEDT